MPNYSTHSDIELLVLQYVNDPVIKWPFDYRTNLTCPDHFSLKQHFCIKCSSLAENRSFHVKADRVWPKHERTQVCKVRTV